MYRIQTAGEMCGSFFTLHSKQYYCYTFEEAINTVYKHINRLLKEVVEELTENLEFEWYDCSSDEGNLIQYRKSAFAIKEYYRYSKHFDTHFYDLRIIYPDFFSKEKISINYSVSYLRQG